MTTIGSLLALIGVVGTILAIIALIRPLPSFKLGTRPRAAGLLVASLAVTMIASPMLPDTQEGEPGATQAPAGQITNTTPPPPPSSKVVDPGVIAPLTPTGYPKTFAKWKASGVRRIDALRAAAAKTVAQNPKCDYVETSELSEARSAPPTTPVVFVDCHNRTRFYLGEDDIGKQVQSETEKGAQFGPGDVIIACEAALRRQLNVPLSFDRDWLNTSSRQVETTGSWVVDFTFKAQNRLGAKLPGRAECTTETDGTTTVRVIE